MCINKIILTKELQCYLTVKQNYFHSILMFSFLHKATPSLSTSLVMWWKGVYRKNKWEYLVRAYFQTQCLLVNSNLLSFSYFTDTNECELVNAVTLE